MKSPRPPKQSVFKQPALLTSLAPGERARILQQCAARHYRHGEHIVRARDGDTNLYLIARGAARVTLYSRGGREVSFVTLAAGENFGEISALDGKPRSGNVIALGESEIIVMPAKVFGELLLRHPRAAAALLQQLAAVIRRLSARIFEYSTLGVINRVHAELLRLARDNLDLDGVARIAAPPTHAQLAGRVSCHREAVSRELKSLERRGVLQKKTGKWIIADIARLQAMVDHVIGDGISDAL